MVEAIRTLAVTEVALSAFCIYTLYRLNKAEKKNVRLAEHINSLAEVMKKASESNAKKFEIINKDLEENADFIESVSETISKTDEGFKKLNNGIEEAFGLYGNLKEELEKHTSCINAIADSIDTMSKTLVAPAVQDDTMKQFDLFNEWINGPTQE